MVYFMGASFSLFYGKFGINFKKNRIIEKYTDYFVHNIKICRELNETPIKPQKLFEVFPKKNIK
jgi:hypothetical protein